MKPSYGSLFSGVGGMDLGFDRAGFDCLFQVEIDKNCRRILDRVWPSVSKYGDIRDVNGAELPPVDVIAFGSPCQDLSTAGKRAGLDGDRSSMFFEAIRVIEEIQRANEGQYPKIIVWENVPGALTSNKGRDYGRVIEELENLGTHLIEWAVLDAQHFGVPQRRRRLFLIAVLDPSAYERCPDPLLPVREGRRGDYQKGISTRSDTSRTLPSSAGNDSDVSSRLVVKVKKPSSDQDFERWEDRDLAPTLVAWEATRPSMLAYEVRENDQRNWLGIDEVDVLPTLVATQPSVSSHHAQTFICDERVRRLTPLECERLMGWPDDHTLRTIDGTEQTDNQRMRQIGNGVAAPVAQWIAELLKEII